MSQEVVILDVEAEVTVTILVAEVGSEGRKAREPIGAAEVPVEASEI